MTIRAVALDVFGTLIRTTRDRTDPYTRLLNAVPADIRPERRSLLTKNVSLDDLAHSLGVDYLLPVILQELREQTAGFELFDDVPPTLLFLRARGLKVAACSNLATAYGDPVRELLPGMDAYVFSYEVGAAKPAPEIYQALCEALSCRPHEVLFIGDGHRSDVEGPAAYGMYSCGIDRAVHSLHMTARAAVGNPKSLRF
jgi:HAD superfamily hydrolase (TIGR01549 family)